MRRQTHDNCKRSTCNFHAEPLSEMIYNTENTLIKTYNIIIIKSGFQEKP